MSAVNRADKFTKIHKILKKCCKPASPASGRSVIEYLLFACCLEDSHHDVAEEAFAALVHTFFDWNEVRVTSISELAEVMACLPDPRAAANRIKRVLHSVFEATFNFDLEEQKKKNLGPTIQWLEKLDGTTPFVVAYVVQAALDGHAIPIDAGTMGVLRVLDVVTEKDATVGVVPGLERAVPKSKGIEFGSLLHEFGADFSANPYSAAVREILLQMDPECGPRLPKRRAARVPKSEPAEKSAKERAAKPGEKTKPAKEPEKAAEKPVEKSASVKKQTATSHSQAEAPKKKPAATPEPAKRSAKDKSALKPSAAKKPSASEGLSKRKPR
jgi:endonuclease III